MSLLFVSPRRRNRPARRVAVAVSALVCAVVVAATCATPFVARAHQGGDVNAVIRDNDPLTDTVAGGRGRVNYGAGTIRATGYGALPKNAISPAQARLMALGAARADALRTLALTVSSVQVTANTRVKNYVLQNDAVQTRIEALLQSPRIVSEVMGRDGIAKVVVELPMYGEDSVAAAVLPEVLPAPPDDVSLPPAPTWTGPSEPAVPIRPARPRPVDTTPVADPGPTPDSDNGPFTSVLVDCRGLDIQAIMSPKLMDETGREVYGTVRVTPEYAIETGIVGYPRSIGEALRGARTGTHPLIVRALRAGDTHRFNPVISSDDAERILRASRRDRFLERTAVVFLVDPVR